MDWYNANKKTPEPYVSVLCYIPSEAPMPTIHEGYVTDDGVWCICPWGLEYDVAYWTDMPEFPE